MDAAVAPRLSDRQRIAWLRLIRTENVGPATFRDLINRFGSAQSALDALPELAARANGTRPRIYASDQAEAELEAADRMGAAIVGIGEPEYPPMLRRIPQPPPMLAIKGDYGLLARPAVGMVGARNASLAGIKLTRSLSSAIGRGGYAVVSGLARGIDAAAHAAAIDTGTVAVLAGGLDRPYPPENRTLCDEIGTRGALISEMPFGWEPRARDFPRRNRLVAGLCIGLVVVEAAVRSGSLISARLAGEMGRLVFAVPGSPLDPRAAGTNGLLKDGAIMVTEAGDVLDALGPISELPAPEREAFEEPPDFASAPEPDDSARGRIVEALGPVPVAIDDIIAHTGLHPAQIFMVLLELDLAGRLERHPGSKVSLL